jgi:hypothetical protein
MPSGPKIRAFERLEQALAVDPREQNAQHVGRKAIVPGCPRLGDQRRLAQHRHPFVGRHVGDDPAAPQGCDCLLQFPEAVEIVGYARTVREQVKHRDRPVERLRLGHRPGRAFQHLHVGQFGQPVRHRIVEADLAFFQQLQDAGADNRLGHRGDAEDRVAPHRLARLDIHHAVAAFVDEVPAQPDLGLHPGIVAAVRKAFHRIGQALQAVHSHRAGHAVFPSLVFTPPLRMASAWSASEGSRAAICAANESISVPAGCDRAVHQRAFLPRPVLRLRAFDHHGSPSANVTRCTQPPPRKKPSPFMRVSAWSSQAANRAMCSGLEAPVRARRWRRDPGSCWSGATRPLGRMQLAWIRQWLRLPAQFPA